MQRIAAPMVGGMVTAPLLSMLVVPAVWLLLMRARMASTDNPVRKAPALAN
jgi:Cu(I)/Ag(I) efflux system membrane protein CusA/SilA